MTRLRAPASRKTLLRPYTSGPAVNFNAFTFHFSFRDRTFRIYRPFFAYRCNLIRHGLRFFTTKSHIRLTGIQSIDITCYWYYLDPIQIMVRGVIAHNNGWPLFADFTSHHR